MDLTINQWLLVLLCAFITGISKTGLPGIGIVAVPLMAMVVPAKESVGLILPSLIIADMFAVVYYRRHAEWRYLASLLPCALAGLWIGYEIMEDIDGAALKPVIGMIVVSMLLIGAIYDWLKKRRQSEQNNALEDSGKRNLLLAVVFGLAAGITTMLANAAGPVMILYLLAMKLPKKEFVGTGAWYFFIVNWIKVPLSVNLGIITAQSIKINLISAPVIAAGAVLGILLLKKMPQKFFANLAKAMAALTGIKLLFG